MQTSLQLVCVCVELVLTIKQGLHDGNMWGPDIAQKEEREVERLREQERVRAGRELLQASL